MIPVLLIAGNVIREQRWPVIFLVLWSGIIAVAFSFGYDVELVQNDFVFLLGQQALYAVGFSAFVSSFSLHNELRSRRILGVLSKAIARGQYLAGLLLGVCACSTLYCAAIVLSSVWIARGLAFSAVQFAWLAVVLVAACLLTAAMALFFSTLLNPLPATAATAFLIALPAVLALALGDAWARVIPVYAITSAVLRFSFDAAWAPGAGVLALALAESVAFWLAASWTFAHRDIAVAVE
ncbi:MAG: hypothetical protein ACRD3I_06000 [Terriglobales bacterium]